jgi:5-methylcytosine-specific restriction endonuclease McrA
MSYYSQDRPEQEAFYKSYKWKQVRKAYFKQAKGLCEICLSKGLIKQGEIVHHKIEMDSEKIHNERLAYGFDNLQLVCRECHARIHEKEMRKKQRYKINSDGRVLIYDKNV